MGFTREVPTGHAALCGPRKPRVAPLNLIPATPRHQWPDLHHGARFNYDSDRHADSNVLPARQYDTRFITTIRSLFR